MSYDLLFQQANCAYNAGDMDKAEALCRYVLQAVPDNPDVLNMLGLVAMAKNLPQQALTYFNQAVRQTPDNLPLRFNLASALEAAGKLHEAAAAYHQVLKLNPHIKEAYNNLGGIYEKLQNPDQAQTYYRQALQLDPDYPEAAVNLAALQQDVGMLKKLQEKHPLSALPDYYLALNAYHNHDYAQALSYIKEASKKNKNSPEINLLYANIYLKLEDKQAAIQKFYDVLELNAKCTDALLALAQLENNERYYRQVLDIEPDHLAAHAGYAEYLYQQKRLPEALEEYRKAVIINPDLPELSNNIGLILKDQGDYLQALDLFFNAFMLNPNIPEVSVNMAETLVLLHNNQPQQAVKIAQQWMHQAPDNVLARHTLEAFCNKSASCDNLYAEQLFDNFAASFDRVMLNVKYNVPETLKKLGIKLKGKILDLGCGTGTAAQMFQASDNQFTGVDISRNMLDIAREKNVYETLAKADISTFLQNDKLNFDIVLALDVFDYIGNIENIIKAVAPRPFIFTIENAAEKIRDYHLTPAGRYQHNSQYIETLLHNAGYQKIKQQELILRQENGKDVGGTLFIAGEIN